jgi:arylsulfatase A-like enzyme
METTNSRSVVWITLESTRYDHTSLSGHGRDTTPALKRLADEPDGESFALGHSHAIWTPASSASILTGRAPTGHHVGMEQERLSESVPTLPERFAEAGYRTVCCSPNAKLSSATGLERGFETFHYLSASRLREEVPVASILGYLAKIRRHGGGLTKDMRLHNTGYFLNQLALDHVGADDERPLFLYVHHGDAHQPYTPPPAFRETFADDLPVGIDTSEALALALEMNENLLRRTSVGGGYTDRELAAIEVVYDAQLRYVDSLVKELVEGARAGLDDPIVVVTADHGELLGERGLLAHRFACDTTLTHVPMVVAGLDPGTVDTELVQHADVMATLVDLLGVDATVEAGTSLYEGAREYAFTQRGEDRYRAAIDDMRERGLEPPLGGILDGTVTSAIDAEYRFELSSNGSAQLHQLPDEVADVADDHPEVTDEMRAATEAWLAANSTPVDERGTETNLDDGMRDQLRQLGYLID